MNAIVIAALESYEVVRRQILWFERELSQYPWRLVIVDDGSVPAIPNTAATDRVEILRIEPHAEPWTQPRARNVGALHCKDSEYILFTDIDHIISVRALYAATRYLGDKLHFVRRRGALDSEGRLVTNREILIKEYGGGRGDTVDVVDEHYNTFMIRRSIHVDLMGGYDEKFCGKYGGDDTDYSKRYAELHYSGKVDRSDKVPECVYVYPDPKSDRAGLFHQLRQKGHTAWN